MKSPLSILLLLTIALSSVSAFASDSYHIHTKGGVTSGGADPTRISRCLLPHVVGLKRKISFDDVGTCGLSESQTECAVKMFNQGYPVVAITRECK